MNEITNIRNKKTMSSLSLLEIINRERLSAGEPVARNTHFIARVADELDLDVTVAKKWQPINGGTPQAYFDLDIDQCLLVGMRESKAVRKSVQAKLNELKEKTQVVPEIPQTYAAALLEAGRLALLNEEQAKQIEQAKPKVDFFDDLVDKKTLMTATQVGSKHGLSAIKLNKCLDDIGGVYNQAVKRSRVFSSAWISKGYGEVKQTELGHSQSLFTPAGEAKIHELLTSEGVI